MREHAADGVRNLEHALRVQLLKLPRRIKTMSVHDFVMQFSGDVKSVVTAEVQQTLDAIRKTPAKAVALATAAARAEAAGIVAGTLIAIFAVFFVFRCC